MPICNRGMVTTLTFVASTVIVEMVLGVLLALLFNREIRGKICYGGS